MTEENKKIPKIWENKTLIIAVGVLVLAVVFMYLQDQKQQRTYELRSLERRVELLEEWGRPQQNWQSNTPPPSAVVNALVVSSYIRNGDQGRCFNFLKELAVIL